jgi:hypothetical protein
VKLNRDHDVKDVGHAVKFHPPDDGLIAEAKSPDRTSAARR